MRKAGADKDLVIDKEDSYRLEAGDVVCVETGGGGGYGPVKERTLDAIQRDVDAGYVSPGAAMHDYGVTIDAQGRVQR